MPNVGGNKAKRIAFKDITEECGEGKFYTRNYICIESRIIGLLTINDILEV